MFWDDGQYLGSGQSVQEGYANVDFSVDLLHECAKLQKNLKSGKKILKLFNFACKNEEEALKAFKTKKNPFGMG